LALHEVGADLAGTSTHLLTSSDEYPVAADNLGGSSPLLLLGDHAGRAIPARLGDLGLTPEDLERHIAWDIGVAGLGARLAGRLDATFIHQRYCRLVIDCNRAVDGEDCIASKSDGVTIPGNLQLPLEAKRARIAEIYEPYHTRISAELIARRARGQRTILLSLHSFTPSLAGVHRPWRFGVLHRNDSMFSSIVLNALRVRWPQQVGDNQPYAMDGVDFTIPFHADAHRLDYLELEVRQDLIANETGQDEVAPALAGVLQQALDP
jgi:predicted N-formylglutamate amidohydrolase